MSANNDPTVTATVPPGATPGLAPQAGAVRAERTAAELVPGEILAGRYQILSMLGKGGMGAVYQARTQDGALVALKTLRDVPFDSSDDVVKRFWREIRATSAIVHPHVVRLLDSGAHGHTPYLVMELLDGKDLGAAIKDEGPLDPALTVRIFIQICRGLEALHAQQIVHRDIKPSNIFLHRDPSGKLVPKVCDLGLAKFDPAAGAVSTELTHTGGLLGSPHYMSPEQVKDSKRVDARTDVWSVCVSLYEALAGRKRWASCPNVGDLLVTICTQDSPRLADDAPWLNRALCDAIHWGMRRDREERVASMAALIAVLEPFAAPESALVVGRLHALSNTPEMAQARSGGLVSKVGRDGLKEPPPRSRRRIIAAALLSAATAAGLAALWVSGSFISAPWASAALARGRLAILPPSALVTVEGVPTPVQDGSVWIQAREGEPVRVIAKAGSTVTELVVRLSRGGRVEPSQFDVYAVARASKAAGAAKGTSATAPTTATATATATATPTATATATATAKATATATAAPASCGTPGYRWDESKNPGGPNRCTNGCQCDGARTCSPAGFCQGTAR